MPIGRKKYGVSLQLWNPRKIIRVSSSGAGVVREGAFAGRKTTWPQGLGIIREERNA